MIKDMEGNRWKISVNIYKNPEPTFSNFTSIWTEKSTLITYKSISIVTIM